MSQTPPENEQSDSIEQIESTIVEIIIERLELEDYTAEDFPREEILFALPEEGGLGLDSIASLEIVAGLSEEFELDFDDVAREDFMTVKSLAAFVHRQKQAERDG